MVDLASSTIVAWSFLAGFLLRDLVVMGLWVVGRVWR